MSYLNGKMVSNIVVPVYCESDQGTAFFINSKQLLTARHVVKAHFQSTSSPAAIYICVSGQNLLCKGEELSYPRNIDLALLTIVSEEDYQSAEYLTLLCDQYVRNLSFHVYGYPQELAIGRNLVEMDVRNGLEIVGGVWNDRALIRDDKLAIHSFDGLSGAPVVSISGRVIGIIVLQINETLSYLSISKVKENLDNKGIKYDTNWEIDDTTTIGIGRVYRLCKEAVANVHDRYTPELHQNNESIEKMLDYISNKQQLLESTKNLNSLAKYIVKIQKKIQKNSNIPHDVNIDMLMSNGGDILNRCYDYIIKENNVRSMLPVDVIRSFNLDSEDFNRYKYAEVKNLCLTGKAGTGKTHSLCNYALNHQNQANIYLFFGTDFKPSQSVISHIKNIVCEGNSFEDFNQMLKERNRYAVIVIDAINEGLGCRYWNNHLSALRNTLDSYDYIKLVISVRTPFDKEVNDLAESSKWHIQKIDGFIDKDKAVQDYFKKYQIHQDCLSKHIEAFKNPLFLKIFCETYHSLTEEEKKNVNRLLLYKRYVSKKNEEVTSLVDEDPELNIADKFLSKLANYSVYCAHFNPITRHKAREYGKRMAPYRLWEKDLLHACLTVNLLLNDRSQTDEPAIMFEYENLGDYYKAGELLQSKMSVNELLRWVNEEFKFFKRNNSIPSEKSRTAIKALFDCWHYKGVNVYDNGLIQKGGILYELYCDFLMESDIPHEQLLIILLKLENSKISPLLLAQKCNELTLDEILQIHNRLKDFPTVGSRDLIWTRYINQMYEKYGDEYITDLYTKQNYTLDDSNSEKKILICITWMLSSSHPRLRAIIIRKLKRILQLHQSLILWLIELFEGVNDPYILGGLFCSVCGVLLPSRNGELVATIARYLYHCYYENENSIPQDLIVRQWTLKIIERAYFLDEKCDFWKLIKTPFKPQIVSKNDIPDNITQGYFGLEWGSKKMYNSLFGFEDFNRYVIGTNNRKFSNKYFLPDENGKFQGVKLYDIMTKMAFYIKYVFGWNDKLGYLDNRTYSLNRFNNERERIGKKFQWLAWYRINAHLMDTCYTSKYQSHYRDEAKKNELTQNPYPWNSTAISRFDPTLDIKQKDEVNIGLMGIEKQTIENKDDENWINKNEFLPDFRYIAKLQNGTEYVMLIGYDTSDEDGKEIFLFSNAGFVKQQDAEKFAEWAKKQNFYGRWMPEHQGCTGFLWNDYPWSDVYKSSIEHEIWSHPQDCPCNMQLAYEAQLQENWEGIDNKNEFLSTVYMPCVEIMEQMGLYCSEIRGQIKDKDGIVVALNTDQGNGIHGLFLRRDILNDYLKRNEYVMFYYVLGEKLLKIGEMNSIIKDLSAAYQYRQKNEVIVLQSMRVIER